MRRYEMTIRTGLVLLLLGVGAALGWPTPSPGRLLSDSDLAKIQGLNPFERSNSIYPVGCEAFQIIPNAQTPQQCAQFGGAQPPNPAISCIACSDQIATYTGVQAGPSGFAEFNDGMYFCHGQLSEAPCTGAAGSGQCGTYAPVQGVTCDNFATDWDPQ